jgi:hypothetical protein
LGAFFGDEVGDVGEGERLGGIFFAVGDDGDDDGVGVAAAGRAANDSDIFLRVRPMASSRAVPPRGTKVWRVSSGTCARGADLMGTS